MSVGDGRRLGGVVPGVGRSGGSVDDGGDGGDGGGRWWWGVLLLVVLGVGGWLEYGSDVRSWVGERTGSEASGTTLVEGRVPEPVEGFDPLVTPSASGVDLVRLREVVGSLEDPVGCPPTGTVGSLDDVVEVLRLVDGCLVLEYVVLEGRSVEEVADGYAPDSGVLAVGRPLRVAADNSHLGDPEAGNQWHLDKMGAESLWAGWPPGAEVTVAVIDSGVDGAHHDLDDNLVVWGKDAHREDRNGHGTHVAGIIAAEAGNGVGGAGVAPDASVVSIRLRLLVPEPYEETAPDQTLFRTLAAAVAEARRSGARVVNMSIHMVDDQNKRADSLPVWCANASHQTCGDPAAWQIRTAQAEGIIFVASSGNCGQKAVANCKSADQIQWPAAYEGVIGVASTDYRDQRSWFSTAAAHVDIAAPGQDILSTLPRNKWGRFRWNPERTDQKSGTSMATPVVTAVIAHLLARFPDATYTQITNSLYKTADMPWLYQSTPQRRTDEFGWGIIHPHDAIQHLHNTLNPPTTPAITVSATTTPPTAATTTTPPTPTTAAPTTTVSTHGQFNAVTAGVTHTCGLRTDRTITCWGSNTSGQADAPGGQFNTVTAGWDHTCGLRTDSTITCWGRNSSGQADAPGGQFNTVTAGGYHTCGLRTNGTITCWGWNDYGQADAPGGQFSTVTAGRDHTCGLRTDGTITCWGDNNGGQADAPGGQFSTVTAGWGHSCGLGTDGTITCWGSNHRGQANAWQANASGRQFSAVAAGSHTCGLRTDGTITCWGYSDYSRIETPGGWQFSAVAAGSGHSCGLGTDGTITCWGYNSSGQANAPGGQFSAVTAGRGHTCGLGTDGTITCWGRNDRGQVETPGGQFSTVTAGWHHTCGLRTYGTITCWGWNDYGQVEMPGGQFSAVPAGGDHTCGLRTDGTITCWGRNDRGQANAPGGQFNTVTAGGDHTCGLRTDGTITCWGNNRSGQADTPGGQFSTVTAGGDHTCGLGTDGTITCWGNNDGGQANAPGGQFNTVTAGGDHTCGLRTDGTITCWGNNRSGQADAPGGQFSAVTAGWGYSCGLGTDGTITCWGESATRTA